MALPGSIGVSRTRWLRVYPTAALLALAGLPELLLAPATGSRYHHPMGKIAFLVLLLLVAMASPPALAGAHTPAECREGADFIRNAAMARDNGHSRASFIDRLVGDLAAIRSLPLKLRWFARDRADERLLIRHAERVFAQPATPDQHGRGFLLECNRKLGDDIEVDPDTI